MTKTLLAAIAATFLLAACGQDASKKGPAGSTTPPTTSPSTPPASAPATPPAEKKVEPKK